MHGAGGGAPKGKRNGRYRTGLFTAEMIEARQQVRALVTLARDLDESLCPASPCAMHLASACLRSRRCPGYVAYAVWSS